MVPQVSLQFQSWAHHQFPYIDVCYSVHSLLSGSNVTIMFTNVGWTTWVCTPTRLQGIPMVGICASWCWSLAHTRSALRGCSFHCFEKVIALDCLFSCPTAIQSIWWGIQLWGLAESSLIPLLSLHDREGSSFPGFIPHNNTVNSKYVAGIKPSDSSVVIGIRWWFTQTWLAENSVPQSHIYPGSWISCQHQIISQLNQAIRDCKHGFDSILTDCTEMLEWDASFDEPDIISFSVSSGFLCLGSTISHNSKSQLLAWNP